MCITAPQVQVTQINEASLGLKRNLHKIHLLLPNPASLWGYVAIGLGQQGISLTWFGSLGHSKTNAHHRMLDMPIFFLTGIIMTNVYKLGKFLKTSSVLLF